MKKLLLFTSLFLVILQAAAQLPPYAWVDGLPGATSSDFSNGNVVGTDGSGNVYVTGYFQGTLDVDPGPGVVNISSSSSGMDVFIMKLDASENLIWVKTIEGTAYCRSTAIAVDAVGNSYITGQFADTADFDPGPGTYNVTSSSLNSLFLLKFDASGNLLFAKFVQGTGFFDVSGISLALNGANNLCITGTFLGTVDFDPGPGAYPMTSTAGELMFILKLTSTGGLIWARQMESSSSAVTSTSIDLDAAGNVYSTGFFSGSADFDPGAGVFTMSTTSSATVNGFILKLDAAGNFAWAKRYAGGGSNYFINLDASGNIYTAGDFTGTADFDPGTGVANLTATASAGFSAFISKLDNAGNYVWAKSLEGEASGPTSLAMDGSGNLYITGTFQGTVDFDPGTAVYNVSSISGSNDVFIWKTDPAGNFIDAINIGGATSPDNKGSSITVDGSGNVYTVGKYRGTVDFDPGLGTANLTGIGPHNMFIHKLGYDVSSGIHETLTENISAYPNPSTGVFTISGLFKTSTINVYDISGRLICTQQSTKDKAAINLDSEATGIYFVQIISDKTTVMRRIVKQ